MTDTLSATRRDVLAACLDYEWASDHNGADPLGAGARLRILAKRYAKAFREAHGGAVEMGGAAQGRHADGGT
jgi:hypothetical protein